MKLPLFILSFVLVSVFSIETTILEQLTKNDQTSLIMAGEFMNILESEKYFNRQKFTCLTLMPTNFTTQKKQTVHKLNLTFSYKKQRNILQTITPTQQSKQKKKKITGYRYDHDYDKILDLLHGTCVVHQTNEFLYEYCHKEKVRQFDDLFTKQRMAKVEYEDIAMGYYNYQSALQKSTSPHDKGLKPGNGMYQIKYSQNGDLTILNKLLQNVPQLTSQQRQLLEKTISENLMKNELLENDNEDSNEQRNKVLQTNPKDNTIKVQLLPTRSVVYDQNNLFTVETVNHKEYYLNKQTKIIHLNYPIVKSNKYFTKAQLIYEVICVNNNNNINNGQQKKQGVYVSKGVVVSPFQLLFLGEVEKCDIVKQVGYKSLQENLYNEPYYINRMRVIEDVAYGYVEEFCGNNWDWQFQKNKQSSQKNKLSPLKNNHLQPGTTLWLQIAINSTSTGGRVTFHHYPVTVKQIIANGVIKMQQNILGKLNIKNAKDIVWINSCKIISKKTLNKKYHTIQNQIVRKNVIKIKQLPQKNQNDNNQNPSKTTSQKHSGDQLLCLCRFRKHNEHFLEMHLTLGKKLFQSNPSNNYFSYFEFYQTLRTVKTEKYNDDNLYTLCSGGMLCFDVEKEDKFQITNQQKQQVVPNDDLVKQQKNSQGFTTITKLTPYTQPLEQSININQQIIIIQTSQHGLIKLHTQTSQGEKFYYLISPSMLIKYRTYQNGTKQVYKENSFYQNQTTLHYMSWFSTSLYIHKGYIWRGNDKLVFPRMAMTNGERVVRVECLTGSGYVRRWDLNKMKNIKSNMIVDVQKMFDEHYKMVKVPIYEDENKKAQDIDLQTKQLNDVKPQYLQELQVNQIQQNIKQTHSSSYPQQQSLKKQQQQSVQYSKHLQKSVSVRYQYFHGDFCTHPINKYRRTNVNLQCGQPWMKIQQVKQTSPCVYEMIVSTKLLCRQEYQKMIERVQSLVKGDNDSRVRLQKGIVCYPQNAWDDALYVYDVEKKDINYNTK